MPTRSFLCRLVLFLLFTAFAHAARADDASQAEELKKRGNQAMLDLNYAEALEAYRAAIALTPNDAVLYYNLGRAHQAREDYPAALDALEEFERKGSQELRSRVPNLDALISDVRSRVATVAVKCTESVGDGTVTVGEKATISQCGPAPKTVRLSVPRHGTTVDVRLTANAWQATTEHVAVTGGGAPVAVTLTVLAKATSGILVVRASPAHAVVSVDGVERGNPPVEILLPSGPHTVDVRAAKHDSSHVPVIVDVGQSKEVLVPLKPSEPLTAKWWFWTGVGVVVVGVAVTTWYLVAQPEEEAGKGTIDPGQVSAPLLRF